MSRVVGSPFHARSTVISENARSDERETPETPETPEPPAVACPRCEPLFGTPAPENYEGTPCPTCGRALPLPAGLPGGTVLTMLLSLKVLGETVQQVWETARDMIEDERLRANLLSPIDPETPDGYISLNHASVPDPVSPAVLRVVQQEQAEANVALRRLRFAIRKRKALLVTILKETYGAGFQRDEARVAARLGLRTNTVRRAIRGKKLIRI